MLAAHVETSLYVAEPCVDALIRGTRPCASALAAANYAQLLAGDKAHLVITDPPYNVKIGGNVSGKGAIKHKEFAMPSILLERESKSMPQGGGGGNQARQAYQWFAAA